MFPTKRTKRTFFLMSIVISTTTWTLLYFTLLYAVYFGK